MQKKQFRHRGCKIKLKETLKHTDVEVTLPNNEKFGKRFVDKRPDKAVSMCENEAFEWQLIETVNALLHEKGL